MALLMAQNATNPFEPRWSPILGFTHVPCGNTANRASCGDSCGGAVRKVAARQP